MDKLTFQNLNKSARIIKSGGILAFPTETVYGFGIIYDDEKVFERLNKVKNRNPDKPYSLMCSHVSDIYKYAVVNDIADKIIKAFLPGQLTIILKAKDSLPKWCVSKEGNVGIRVSSDKDVSSLIDLVGKPLLVPSANKADEPTSTNGDDVYNKFRKEIDGVIMGATLQSRATTVILVDTDIKVLREGKITIDQINDVIKGE